MRFRLSFFLTYNFILPIMLCCRTYCPIKLLKLIFLQNLINCVGLKSRYYLFHIHNIVNYIYDNQHILIQRSVKFFINFVKNTKGILEMLESIKRLIKGVTLVLIMEKEKTTIIELSFYDRQHGINSDYPCINTCIIDKEGEDWFTTTYFSWTEFIQEIKAYISYYEAETPQNANYVYIRECEFL